ncbi:monovalent cation/H(+) antiporter subunit G [Methylobacterium oryzisoli]|uniref:monovalent cation/H(+) antiporter subunit G n=1 Tax=Methylobacterium oryzisoli TaxID=3385502 RepID=UPI00389176AB
MSAALPLWAACLVVGLALAGAAVSFVGALGLVRLSHFYERVHAPSLCATLGLILVVAASSLFFSLAEGRVVLRDGLVALFVIVTTPVTLLLLGRAAAYRDRVEKNPVAPPEP